MPPSQRFVPHCPSPKQISVECIWDEKLVIIYGFYVKSCLFEHITDNFSGDWPL